MRGLVPATKGGGGMYAQEGGGCRRRMQAVWRCGWQSQPLGQRQECTPPPQMVTCELSHVGCCLKRRQQQISTCRSQEGGKSLSRVENDPTRLSQKVCGKVVLRVRPNAGERRQHQSHRSYNTRTPPPPLTSPGRRSSCAGRGGLADGPRRGTVWTGSTRLKVQTGKPPTPSPVRAICLSRQPPRLSCHRVCTAAAWGPVAVARDAFEGKGP